MEIRSGHNTSFWFDLWSPLGRLIDVLGSRNGCIDFGIGITDTVASAFSSHRRRRHRLETFNRIEDQIVSTRQAQSDTLETDISLWKCKPDKFSDTFSSSNTWKLSRLSSPFCSWYKAVWFSQTTPKYAFLTLLAAHNRLATGDRIQSWNVGADSSCILCGFVTESRNHLFFSCPFWAQVWHSLAEGILLDEFTLDWDRLLHLLTNINQNKLRKYVFRYTFQAAIHSIWRERNGRKHGEKPLSAGLLSTQIDKNIRNKLSTLQRDGRCQAGLQLWFQTHP